MFAMEKKALCGKVLLSGKVEHTIGIKSMMPILATIDILGDNQRSLY
jgi:hypothetical protein